MKLFKLLKTLLDRIKEVQSAYEELKKKNDATPEPNPFKFESWCVGNPFYEEESPGDGLNVAYFPDEAFDGIPEKK